MLIILRYATQPFRDRSSKNGFPIFLWNVDGFFEPFRDLLEHLKENEFLSQKDIAGLTIIDRLEQMLAEFVGDPQLVQTSNSL
ncbi:MAG: hypothetical protein C5B49_15195 [Bdellovibrio sp.]|nr:MAG: hypothetical protein C5B49_15195 [Bdellovibrio sp.]